MTDNELLEEIEREFGSKANTPKNDADDLDAFIADLKQAIAPEAEAPAAPKQRSKDTPAPAAPARKERTAGRAPKRESAPKEKTPKPRKAPKHT